jgi:hypothetical protein
VYVYLLVTEFSGVLIRLGSFGFDPLEELDQQGLISPLLSEPTILVREAAALPSEDFSNMG